MRTGRATIAGRFTSTGVLIAATVPGVTVQRVGVGSYYVRFPPWFHLVAGTANCPDNVVYLAGVSALADGKLLITMSTTGSSPVFTDLGASFVAVGFE